MGIFSSTNKKRKEMASEQKYEWNKMSKMEKTDYLIRDINNTTGLKFPGEINGQQIIIENCKNSDIGLFDFSSSLIIDQCENCKFIIGPVRGSIFMRDCKDCRIIVACDQLRITDCVNLNVWLYCSTQAVIESSQIIYFHCYSLYYNGLLEQFQCSNLNVWNNNWHKIYDYTPSDDVSNWKLCVNEDNILSALSFNGVDKLDVKSDEASSIVPVTTGGILSFKQLHCSYSCFVVFLDDPSSKSFLQALRLFKTKMNVVRCSQIQMSAQHTELLFLTTTVIKAAQINPIIGIHVYGNNSIAECMQVIKKRIECDSNYYVSPSSNIANHQVSTFFTIVDNNFAQNDTKMLF